MPKEEKKAVHNDIDDLPEEEPLEEFDESDPSEVLNIDLPKPKDGEAGDGSADEEEEDESPAARVAGDAVEAEDVSESAEEPAEHAEAEEEGQQPASDEPFEMVIKIPQPDGLTREVIVHSEEEAQIVQGLLNRYDETRGQLAPLQKRYVETVEALTRAQGAMTQPGQGGVQVAPAAQPTGAVPDQTEAMLNVIPQVVQAYTPVVDRIKSALPEDHEIRDFIEMNPAVASILAAIWDGQVGLQTSDAMNRAKAGEQAFKGHVDSLMTGVIKADEANADLADPEVREQFEAYLVSLGPYDPNTQTYDPDPVRVALMRDDGRWIAERWKDFQSRRFLGGMNPSSEKKTPTKQPSGKDVNRRRAMDAGGGSRSGSGGRSSGRGISQEVKDVLFID